MKNAIKRTISILAAATTLLVSGAMTASAKRTYPCTRYDGHAHGNFIEWQGNKRICSACGEPVYYKGSCYR